MTFKRRQDRTMLIEYETGYTIDKNVDTVINSANGFLLLGTGGAGRIRTISDRLSSAEKLEYQALLNTLPKRIRRWYRHVYQKNKWHRTYAQLSCLRILSNKRNKEYRRGTAVLDTSWSRIGDKRLIHAIAMSYRLTESGAKRKKATKDTIRKALREALVIAESAGSQRIALPLFCSRPSYGVTPEASLSSIIAVLEDFQDSSIQKVVICINSKSTMNHLRQLHLI